MYVIVCLLPENRLSTSKTKRNWATFNYRIQQLADPAIDHHANGSIKLNATIFKYADSNRTKEKTRAIIPENWQITTFKMETTYL